MNCLHRPANARFLLVFDFMVAICDGNECAAALLAFFAGWHDTKVKHREQAKTQNDLSVELGKQRTQSEELLQIHTEDDLERGVMFFKRRSFPSGLRVLTDKGFVSIHHNPNPKFKFDRRRFFLLHPAVVNRAIREYLLSRKIASSTSETAGTIDQDSGSISQNNDQDPPSRKIASSTKARKARTVKGATQLPKPFFEFNGELRQIAEPFRLLGVDVEVEHARFVEYYDEIEKTRKDWARTFNNWLLKAVSIARQRGTLKPLAETKKETIRERRERERQATQ